MKFNAQKKHLNQITPEDEFLHFRQNSNNEVADFIACTLISCVGKKSIYRNPSRLVIGGRVFLLTLLDMGGGEQNLEHRTPTSVVNNNGKSILCS